MRMSYPSSLHCMRESAQFPAVNLAARWEELTNFRISVEHASS